MTTASIITDVNDLPAELTSGEQLIPADKGMLMHPYNAETQQWMAHCTYCGTYMDDQADVPPCDVLCDDC